jgi:hypothetical protein
MCTNLTRRKTEQEAKEVRVRKKRRAVGMRESCILVGVYYLGVIRRKDG